MATLALIRSAFGPGATPYTVLGCDRSSTAADLRRGYRRAALRHHPDRSPDAPSSSTAKFQAVSAAYRALMDEGRRAAYDASGRIVEEECDDDSDDDGDGDSSDGNGGGGECGGCSASFSGKAPGPRGAGRRRAREQERWEQFFRSVFDELASAGARHAADAGSYRRSERERKDVLHYYETCKGDMDKVVECVVHGSVKDVPRWRRDIVAPAIRRGEVGDYGRVSGGRRIGKGGGRGGRPSVERKTRVLEDSSSDEEIAKERPRSRRRRLGKGKSNNNSLLADTDDETNSGEEGVPPRKMRADDDGAAGMSKRDKMNYRVARKRKARAERDMETADIIQSVDWGAGVASGHFGKKRKNATGVSDAVLSNIEREYGNGSTRKRRA